MKFILLVISLFFILNADDPCDPIMTTKHLLHQKLPYNVEIDKYYSEDHCGWQNTELKILQNGQLIDKVNAFYGVDILHIGDINNDGKVEIIYSGHFGGYGNDEHSIATVESNMSKPFNFYGFNISLRSFNNNEEKKFILFESPFFCFTSQLCSHGTSLTIQLAKKFQNNSLVLDQQSTEILKKESNQPCDTHVFITTEQSLEFSTSDCTKNTLEAIAYDLELQNSHILKNDLKYLIFDSDEAKKEFKTKFLNELPSFHITPKSDFGISVKKLIEKL